MSCSQATAPIDISESGSSGTCELKCEYSFSYNNSDTSVTNNGDYLELTYDQASVPPVKFNDTDYRVDGIRIYQPSLHTFNGNYADAEIVIKHSGDTGNLLVCVPIIKSATVTKSASLLNTIMPKVKSYAYADGQSANLNISNFNLNDIIPSKPFYSYTGTLPLAPCNGEYNYIVFDIEHAASMSTQSLATLQGAILPNDAETVENTPFYINPRGPVKTLGSDDDIYIECHPTGADGEILIDKGANGSLASKINLDKFNLKKMTSNPFFLTIVSGLLAFIVFKLAQFTIRKITSVTQAKKAIQTIANASTSPLT
jgi:carbonic anhydrase